jgi:MoaA/NifB/PqqE/SkfB family radical SAM enzyme
MIELPVAAAAEPREGRLALPTVLYIEPTNRCNSLCTECPRTFGINTEAPRDLTLAEFDAIIAQVPDVRRVVLHGLGEPLLHRDVARMVARLRGRGVDVTFNTNAISLTRARAAALIEADLRDLRVSMDGARNATYAAIRGVDKLPLIRRNLSMLGQLKAERGVTHPRVSLWFVAMRQNLEELPKLVEMAPEAGAEEIYVQRLVYFGAGTATAEQALFRRASAREAELLARCGERCRELGLAFNAAGGVSPLQSIDPAVATRPWSACRRPYNLTYITAHGNALSCCFVPFTGRPYAGALLGNVLRDGLDAVWNGAAYRAFRSRFESDDPPQWCAGCGSKWSV